MMYFFVPAIKTEVDYYKEGFYSLSNIEQYLRKTISGYIVLQKHINNSNEATWNVNMKDKFIGVIYESENWENFVYMLYKSASCCKNACPTDDDLD